MIDWARWQALQGCEQRTASHTSRPVLYLLGPPTGLPTTTLLGTHLKDFLPLPSSGPPEGLPATPLLGTHLQDYLPLPSLGDTCRTTYHCPPRNVPVDYQTLSSSGTPVGQPITVLLGTPCRTTWYQNEVVPVRGLHIHFSF